MSLTHGAYFYCLHFVIRVLSPWTERRNEVLIPEGHFKTSPTQKFFPESELHWTLSGLGGLEVACWPLVPKFAGSDAAEAVGFFRAKKSSARLPSEGK